MLTNYNSSNNSGSNRQLAIFLQISSAHEDRVLSWTPVAHTERYIVASLYLETALPRYQSDKRYSEPDNLRVQQDQLPKELKAPLSWSACRMYLTSRATSLRQHGSERLSRRSTASRALRTWFCILVLRKEIAARMLLSTRHFLICARKIVVFLAVGLEFRMVVEHAI